jgi:hypothetical protein
MSATESLRSPRDLPSDLPLQAKASQAKASHPTDAETARQAREAFVYRCVVGAWMLTLVGFGFLQLMGVMHVR